MRIEESNHFDKHQNASKPEEARWNARKVSTVQKTRELELLRPRSERPSKTLNPQVYFNYRAREKQIKYELELKQYCLDLLTGHLYCAQLENVNFGCVKASRLRDRKASV